MATNFDPTNRVSGGVLVCFLLLIFSSLSSGQQGSRTNFNENWRFEVKTNIRFKYNQQFIKRPDFVRVN